MTNMVAHYIPCWCVRQLGAVKELGTSRNAAPFARPIMNTMMGNLLINKELSNKIVEVSDLDLQEPSKMLLWG